MFSSFLRLSVCGWLLISVMLLMLKEFFSGVSWYSCLSMVFGLKFVLILMVMCSLWLWLVRLVILLMFCSFFDCMVLWIFLIRCLGFIM